MKDVKFVDNEMFKTIVKDEGLYYATLDYIDPETIEDEVLSRKVKNVRYLMNEIKEYIERDDKK